MIRSLSRLKSRPPSFFHWRQRVDSRVPARDVSCLLSGNSQEGGLARRCCSPIAPVFISVMFQDTVLLTVVETKSLPSLSAQRWGMGRGCMPSVLRPCQEVALLTGAHTNQNLVKQPTSCKGSWEMLFLARWSCVHHPQLPALVEIIAVLSARKVKQRFTGHLLGAGLYHGHFPASPFEFSLYLPTPRQLGQGSVPRPPRACEVLSRGTSSGWF